MSSPTYDFVPICHLVAFSCLIHIRIALPGRAFRQDGGIDDRHVDDRFGEALGAFDYLSGSTLIAVPEQPFDAVQVGQQTFTCRSVMQRDATSIWLNAVMRMVL